MTDSLPPGLTYVLSIPSTGTYNSTTGIWNIGSINDNQTETLTITALITAKSGTLQNTAAVTAEDQIDWNEANNSKTTDYTITGNYTPSVEMCVFEYPWYYDSVYGYEYSYSDYNTPVFMVDVENWGNNDATGVVVNDALGTGFQYIALDTEGIGTATYNPVTGIITWNIGNMSSNGVAYMIVVEGIRETGDYTPALTNTASLAHVDQYDVPNDYKSNSCSITVPAAADLQVNQNYTTNAQDITYTITVKNNGPDNATGVQVTDSLPPGLTYVSSIPSTGTYNSTTGIWNIGSINDNQTETLTITALITAKSGTLQNTAAVTAEDQIDWNEANNSKTTDYTITGNYTPSVEMCVFEYPWYYDTQYGYEYSYSDYNTPVFMVDVENWGNNDATGVVVNDALGTGFQYIALDTEGIGTATYNPVTGIITWNIGNMSSNGVAYMIVVEGIRETGDYTPALTNTASLAHVDQYDVPNDYKSNSCSITVPAAADLQVNQNYTTNAQDITYTITVKNNGPDNATGVQVTDSLPPGLTYVSSIPSTGTYNSTTGIWNIGSINDNQTETLTITAEITGTGDIQNTAAVTAEDQIDWNQANDSQTTNLYLQQ